ncbi:MAG: alpha/beta hydrolase [Caulobacter sp.]|nr:alpha/beta hydrolase [Caulobacter sp.]
MKPAAAWLLLCGLLAGCAPGPVRGAGPEASCAAVGPQTQALAGAHSKVYRTTRGGRDLKLHIIPAATGDGPRPAILLFFGGGWRTGNVEAFEPQARAFAARGYVAVLADYRVKCRDGSTPMQSTNDAEAGYAWLRAHAAELNVDPRRIALGGGSAGGQLALATAQKAPEGEKPAALVLFNPVVDIVKPARLWQKLFAWDISPSTLPLEGLPPTMIFHGEADASVPIASVRTFCDRAWGKGRICVVHGYPGEGHGFYRAPAPYADTMAKANAFLDRLAVTGPYVPKT